MLIALALLVVGIRLVTALTGPEGGARGPWALSPTPSPPVAVPEAPAEVDLPAQRCPVVDELSLADLVVTARSGTAPAGSTADLVFSPCTPHGSVQVIPVADALLSSPGVAGDADAAACGEFMRQGTVNQLAQGVGATFCALQRSAATEPDGRQVLARVTVSNIAADGTVTLRVVRWLVSRTG